MAVVCATALPVGADLVTDAACARIAGDHDCHEWETHFPADPPTHAAYGVAGLLSDDGSVIHAVAATSSELVVVAVDASSGNLLWRAATPDDPCCIWPAGASADAARGVLLVAGATSGRAWAVDGATGATLWTADVPDAHRVRAVALTPDAAVALVVGTTVVHDGAGDVLVAALDAATGAVLWARHVDGLGHGEDVATDVLVTADGTGAVVVAESWGFGTREDHLVMALDVADGSDVWTTRVNTPFNDRELDPRVTASPDGARILVAGTTREPSSSPAGSEWLDYHVALLDGLDGRVLATDRFDGVDGTLSDRVRAVATDPGGDRFYVTGTIRARWSPCCIGMDDAVTIAYDPATGDRLWVDQFASRSSESPRSTYRTDDARDLEVMGDTLFLLVDHGGAWSVVAYDAATGHRHWNVSHDVNTGSVPAAALALAPDGSLAYAVGTGRFEDGSREQLAAVAFPTDWPRPLPFPLGEVVE